MSWSWSMLLPGVADAWRGDDLMLTLTGRRQAGRLASAPGQSTPRVAVAGGGPKPYFAIMRPQQNKKAALALTEEWPLPAAATLGSSVRAKGILLEIRARLPWAVRKSLDLAGGVLVLRMPEDEDAAFRETSAAVTQALQGIEDLPVIPREIEDILTIKTSERHRWLKDGRLRSAGTRTVKLRGRARQITFHVFDPRHVEDLLDRDVVDSWREDDIEARSEKRRLAAATRRLSKPAGTAAAQPERAEEPDPRLRGWAEFERLGLLR